MQFGRRERPGDVQHVQTLGIKKWIDLQLHPERIPGNPLLENKLRPLDTLGMSTAKMLESYPSPALVKAMLAGKLPFPDDPDKRMMVDRLAARLQGKTNQDGGEQECEQQQEIAKQAQAGKGARLARRKRLSRSSATAS